MLILGNGTQDISHVMQYQGSVEGWEHQNPTLYQNQDIKTTYSIIYNLIKVPSDLYDF